MKALRVGLMQLGQFINTTQTISSTQTCSTHFLLDQFNFQYRIVKDKEIREGIPVDIDVLILPGDVQSRLEEGEPPQPEFDPEYATGLGKSGKINIVKFVENGGKLFAWSGSCNYIIEAFSLNIINAICDVPKSEFNAYRSTLNIYLYEDTITTGMPKKAKILFCENNAAFVVTEHQQSSNYKTLGRYAEENLLSSGFIDGEDKIAGLACLLRIKYGKGEIIMCGFDPRFRGQTWSTFKLFFNPLFKWQTQKGSLNLPV
jgi:hypothetical protein